MPFKVTTVDEQRRAFVMLARQDGANISALCRRFGISRQHGYTLLRRAASDGVEELACRSRRPKASPTQLPKEVEARVVRIRTTHPDWGARKIQHRLKTLFADAPPAQSTITQVLHRHGLIDPATARQPAATHRFERDEPNDLWQMDFLGHKPMQRGRVHPLTIIDDHSRYGLTVTACANETLSTVWPHLERCFQQYGLPWSILTDNCAPWGHAGDALTTLEVRLLQLGIRVLHGRPYHPQTQGKVERWHSTITGAVFGPIPYQDLEHAQRAFDAFRVSYNTERPHEALDMDVPINRYRPSPRCLPDHIEPPVYDDALETRKVRISGEIKVQGRRCRVSQSLAGEIVGLQPTTIDGIIDIYYYNHKVRTIDLRLTSKEVDV